MDNTKKYYEYLRGAGADVPPTLESFSKTLSNEDEAKIYFDYLKSNNFDTPETFESFYETLGVKKKGSSASDFLLQKDTTGVTSTQDRDQESVLANTPEVNALLNWSPITHKEYFEQDTQVEERIPVPKKDVRIDTDAYQDRAKEIKSELNRIHKEYRDATGDIPWKQTDTPERYSPVATKHNKELREKIDPLIEELETLTQNTRKAYTEVNKERVKLINEAYQVASRIPDVQATELLRERDLKRELEDITKEIERPRSALELTESASTRFRKSDELKRKREIEQELHKINITREVLREKLLYNPTQSFFKLPKLGDDLSYLKADELKLDPTLFPDIPNLSDSEKLDIVRAKVIENNLNKVDELDEEARELRTLANNHFFDPIRNVASSFLGMSYGVSSSIGNYIMFQSEREYEKKTGEILPEDYTTYLGYWGDRMAGWGEKKADPYLQYSQPFMDAQPDFHWSQLGTEDFWIANAGHLSGSIAVFGSIGILAGLTGGAATAGMVGMGKMALTGLIGSSLSTPALSAVYAGDAYRETYEQLMSQGLSHEKSHKLASEAGAKTFRTVFPATFAFNTALLGVSYGSASLLGKQPAGRIASNIAGRLTAPISSGLDNFHQEWAKHYFVQSALGENPVDLFQWGATPEGQFSFYAGAIMSVPHVVGGMIKSTIDTPAGKMNLNLISSRKYLQDSMASKFAIMGVNGVAEAKFVTDVLVKDGTMTEEQQSGFLDNVSGQVGKHKLLGEAAVMFSSIYSIHKDMSELAKSMPEGVEKDIILKDINEFEADMAQLIALDAMNKGQIQVIRQGGELIPYVQGQPTEVQSLTEFQKRYYDKVSEMASGIDLLGQAEPLYVVMENGRVQNFRDKAQFLDFIKEATDRKADIKFQIHEDIEALSEANDIIDGKMTVESNVKEFAELNGVKDKTTEVAQETAPEAREERIREIYKKTGNPRALRVEMSDGGTSIQIGESMQPIVIKNEADIDTHIQRIQEEAEMAAEIKKRREAEVARDEEMKEEFPYRLFEQRFKDRAEFIDALRDLRDTSGFHSTMFTSNDIMLGDVSFAELEAMSAEKLTGLIRSDINKESTEELGAIQENAESNVKFLNELRSEFAETPQAVTQQAQETETVQQDIQPISEPKTLSDKINNLIVLTLGFKNDMKSARQVLADFIKENKAELSKINPRRIPKILNQLNTELTADQLQVVLGNLKDAVESAKEITTRKDIETEAKRLSESIKKLAKPKIKKDKKLVGARVVEESKVKKEVDKILSLSDTERQNYINKMERTANEGGEISTAEAIAIDYAHHLISSQEALDIINSKEFSLEEKADALETLKLNESKLKERDQNWLAERTKKEEARREEKAKKVAMGVEGSTKHRQFQLETYIGESVAEINEGALPAEALDGLLIKLRIDGQHKKADKIWKKLSPLLEDATIDAKKFKEAMIKIIPSKKLPFDNIEQETGREGWRNRLSGLENFDGMVHTVFGRASRELAEQARQALSQPVKDARTKWEDLYWQGRQLLEKGAKIFPNDLLGRPLAPSNQGKMGIYEFNDSKESLGVEMTLKERTRKEDGEEVVTARARAVETLRKMSFAEIAYLATFIKDPSNINELGKKYTPDSVARLVSRVDDVMYGETNLITPEKQKQLQDYVEFMETEFYPAIYDMVNEVYERMYHTSLPKSEYAFVPRFVANRIANIMDMSLDGTEARQTASTFMSPPHIKRRVGSSDVDVLRNAMITADNYLRTMVDFAAFAEVKRDMTSFFHNKDVRMAVKRLNGGEKYLQIFDAFLEDIPNPKRDVESSRNMALHFYRNMMLSVLRLNPGVFVTQLGSTPNFVESMKFESGWKRFVPGLQSASWTVKMFDFFTEKGRADWLEYYNNFFESGFAKIRLNKGFDASLMAANRSLFIDKMFSIFNQKGSSAEAKMNKINQFIMSDVGMKHIKMGDIAAFMGGKPVYVKLRDALIKDGFTVEDAQKKAMDVVTQAGALSQQSFYAENRSHFQRRSGLSGIFYYFTTKMQYQQKINMAGRNIVRDVLQRGELPNVDDLDNLFRYGILQPVIYRGLKWAIAMSLFARDTKEEKELKEGDLAKIGFLMEAAAPYMQGVPMVGDAADYLGRNFQGKDTYAFKVGGLSKVTDVTLDAIELMSALDYDENGKLKPLTRRQERLLDNVLNESYSATGINPRVIKKWIYLATGDPSDRKPIKGIDKEVRDAFERGLFLQEFVNEDPDNAASRAKKYQAYALNDYTDRQTRKDLEYLLVNYPTDRVVRYMEARRKDFRDNEDFFQNFIYKYSDPVDESGKVTHYRLGTYERMNKKTGEWREYNINNVLSRRAVEAWMEKYFTGND